MTVPRGRLCEMLRVCVLGTGPQSLPANHPVGFQPAPKKCYGISKLCLRRYPLDHLRNENSLNPVFLNYSFFNFGLFRVRFVGASRERRSEHDASVARSVTPAVRPCGRRTKTYTHILTHSNSKGCQRGNTEGCNESHYFTECAERVILAMYNFSSDRLGGTAP